VRQSGAEIPERLQIGKAAHVTGLSIDTIRFYQRLGLLKHVPRTLGGYRVFGDEELGDLRFIARAHESGFSLAEIKELMALRSKDAVACPEVRTLLQNKLSAVRQKINELQHLENELKLGLRKCNRKKERCPVLREIEEFK
jgi:DNA-binding transcriptional MerR regulator